MNIDKIKVQKVLHTTKDEKHVDLALISGWDTFWNFWRISWFMDKENYDYIGKQMGWKK